MVWVYSYRVPPGRDEVAGTPAMSEARTPDTQTETRAVSPDELLAARATVLFRHDKHGDTVSVHEWGNLRWLQFGSPAIQSAMRSDMPTALMLSYLPLMMAVHLFLPVPRHLLLFGLGGGAIVRHLYALHPRLQFTVVENRPLLGEVCQDYFALPRDPRRIAFCFTDAMDWLRRQRGGDHDLVMVDLYGRDSLPFFMYEEAFYQLCHTQLASNGVLAANLLVRDEEELAYLLRHLRQVFDGRTLCLNTPGQHNVIVLAFRGEAEGRLAILRQRAEALGVRLGVDYPRLVERLRNANPVRNGRLPLS